MKNYWNKGKAQKVKDQSFALFNQILAKFFFSTILFYFIFKKIKHSNSTHEIIYNPTNFNKLGIIRHFERIDLAKKKKQEKDQVLNKFNGNFKSNAKVLINL